MTLHDLYTVFAFAISAYFAGFLIFYLLCGIAYVGNAVMVTIESWLDRTPVEPQQLQVNLHKMCAPSYYPFVWPLLILLIALFVIMASFVLPYVCYVHRIKPLFASIKFNANYKVLPLWASNDSMASFLNKLIGRKNVQ